MRLTWMWGGIAALALAGLGMPPGHAQERGKKLIATGWDMPSAERCLANAAVMGERPFDGVLIGFAGRGNTPGYSAAFSREPYDPAVVATVIEDLQMSKLPRLRGSFLLVGANPGNVDWFDDAGWAVIVDHWRTAARVARQGGLRGLLFDPEAYEPPYAAFAYAAQAERGQHTFGDYQAKAHQRGREVMAAVIQEYPDLTLFSYFMLSVVADMAERSDPRAGLAGSGYGLYPAFIDGWLDAAPPAVTFVDGCESAYRYNSELDYLAAYARMKGPCQRLLSAANRAKYRAQVQVGFALYLDAYANPPDAVWYIDPMGAKPVERLRQNVATALRVSDEYVWLYGEQASWWPNPHERAQRRWWDVMPGIEEALRFALDSEAFARRQRAADHPASLFLNSDFGAAELTLADGTKVTWQEGQMPLGWYSWQADTSQGTVTWDRGLGDAAPGSVCLAKVETGCAAQTIPVIPGESYAVFARVRQQGRGHPSLRVRWQDPKGNWMLPERDMILDAPAGDQWAELCGTVTVPEGVGKLSVLLGASGQPTAGDKAWFDDVLVFRLALSGEK